jgi:hypothetical protein
MVGHKCPTLEAEATAAIEATVKQKVPPPVPPAPTQEGKRPVRVRHQGRGTEADAEGTLRPPGSRSTNQGHVWICCRLV